MGLEVLSVELLATVQDLGRQGSLALGVTSGGAMDPFAHRLGQRLVGNPTSAAGIEIAQGGFCARALTDLVCCVTGAKVEIAVAQTTEVGGNAKQIPQGTAFSLKAGEVLQVSRAHEGVYSYLAVAGGIDTDVVLGSRSTVTREGLGGHNGRSLRAGDQLPVGEQRGDAPTHTPIASNLPRQTLTLRYISGFQSELAAPEAEGCLTRTTFSVTGARDRMGVRLKGEPIQTGLETLWSEATCPGAIQVPPDGQPIVLLNDRQTMGGYPKLGAVIAPDCIRLAQAPNNAEVVFRRVSPEEADRVSWLERQYEFELSRSLNRDGVENK